MAPPFGVVESAVIESSLAVQMHPLAASLLLECASFFVGSAEAAACPRLRPRAHALAPFAGIEQHYDAAAVG